MPHEPIDPAHLGLIQRMKNARRAMHYRRVFLDEDDALSSDAQKVLADLNRFCRGNASTFHADARTHALLEGRREVLLRILSLLRIDSATIEKYVEVLDE